MRDHHLSRAAAGAGASVIRLITRFTGDCEYVTRSGGGKRSKKTEAATMKARGKREKERERGREVHSNQQECHLGWEVAG